MDQFRPISAYIDSNVIKPIVDVGEIHLKDFLAIFAKSFVS